MMKILRFEVVAMYLRHTLLVIYPYLLVEVLHLPVTENSESLEPYLQRYIEK